MRVGRHKARQNVRLTEVTQPPAQQRENSHKVQAFQHVDIGRVFRFDNQHRSIDAANGKDNNHWRQDQRENHQAGLDGVGPAHRQESADKGIKDSGRSAGPQRRFVAHTKGAFEQTRTGDDAGSTIDSEEHQNDNGGDHPQQLAVVFKTAGEIIR
ncbi:hypothetical protein D3C71_1789650 [compost metagenome]